MNLNLELNAHIDADQAKRKDRVRSGKWSPSSFGRCFRYQIWNRKNEEVTNPIDGFTIRRFLAGTSVHKFIQDLIKGKAQVEVKVEQDDIFGFADIVTDDTVIDIKTVTTYEYKHVDKTEYDPAVNKLPNILQLMTYAKILGKKKGQLSIVNIGNFDIREFEFYRENWDEKVNEELATLRGYWVSGELPDALPRAYSGKECGYCPFRDKCEKQGGTFWKSKGGENALNG